MTIEKVKATVEIVLSTELTIKGIEDLKEHLLELGVLGVKITKLELCDD